MSNLPLPNRVTVIVVLAMAAIQLFLVYSFWGTMAGNDPMMAFAMRSLGIGLAIFELVALVVASHADERGQPGVAAAARIVVSLVFVMNLLGDIGAIATFTYADAHGRQVQAAEFDAHKRQTDTLDEQKTALRAGLREKRLEIPASAIEVQLNQTRSSMSQSGISQETRAWRQNRAAELEAALIMARELERLEGAAGAAPDGAIPAVRPEESHPQFESLSRIANWMGIAIAPDDLRVGLALLMAVVVRCVLLIGLWMALPSHGKTSFAEEQSSGREPSGSGGGQKKKSWMSWIWPKKEEPAAVQAAPAESDTIDPLPSSGDVVPLFQRPAFAPQVAEQVKTAPPVGGQGNRRTTKTKARSAHGGPGHNPKTCPTCNAPVAEGQPLSLLETLDELDPVH